MKKENVVLGGKIIKSSRYIFILFPFSSLFLDLIYLNVGRSQIVGRYKYRYGESLSKERKISTAIYAPIIWPARQEFILYKRGSVRVSDNLRRTNHAFMDDRVHNSNPYLDYTLTCGSQRATVSARWLPFLLNRSETDLQMSQGWKAISEVLQFALAKQCLRKRMHGAVCSAVKNL